MAADTLSADTIVDILRRRAQAEPDRRAYVFLADGELDERVITYGALDQQAAGIARRLLTSNQPGDRVLLLYPPGLEFIAGFFGALYAGLVAVPAYPPRNNSHVPRLEAIMADASVAEALTTARTLASITPFVANHPRFGALRWVTTDDLEAGSGDAGAGRVAADTLALLQYTSGSTGTPKGVMVSHANIAHNSRYIQHCFSLDRSSISASWLPSFHDMGLIDGVIQPLFTGFPGVILPPVSFVQQPVRWLTAISRYGATHGGGPNFGYALCVDKITEEQAADLDLRSWRSAYNGAEPVRADTLRRFADRFAANGVRLRTLYPCYGMAETTLMVSGGHISEDPVFCAVDRRALEQHQVTIADTVSQGTGADTSAQVLVSSGRTQLDTRVRIVNPDTGRDAAATEVGEVWVAGPSVCQGYWQRPDETQQAFQAFAEDGSGPYLRTGDLGFVRHDELFITGRTKDLIIVRGRNLYPQDVEAVVDTAHPAVRPGAGTAFSVEQDGVEQLVIVQELKRRALKSPPVEEIAHAIVKAVAAVHEVEVAAIVLIKTGTIPMTSSGKLQRKRSRELFLNDEHRVVGRWMATADADTTAGAPQSETPADLPDGNSIAQWLTTRVAERLHRPTTDVDQKTPFSQLGLDSLAMVELSGALATFVGRDLAPTLLYDFPTISRLAAHLAAPAPDAPARTSLTATADPIAIVGMSCRLPGNVATVEDFWQLLIDGRDAIGHGPTGRWPAGASNAPPFAGTLADIDRFDPEFFGIAPREAAAMDPQHRLLLELAWEALEHGGIRPETLSGTSTGVFVGISTQDYLSLQLQSRVSAYTGSGNAMSAAAGRISYLLGLEGPSLAVDTACSSSLVAVHLACQSLRTGESSAAIVGGVNLLITPTLGDAFAQAGMMAADGRCKTFDASADGYVRSDGGVVIVLKPLSRAQADGNRMLGVIRGSAVNQDGRSNGLTAPNGPSQERVIRAALADAGLTPADVSYVEAHGTGTSLGDPIEVLALGSVFAERPTPLAIGSAKTNVGHTEAAAGLVGLLKVVLALSRDTIPASLHLTAPNPHIPWGRLPVTVPTTPTPWPVTSDPRRRAGVSSFGFTGTNAHVILESVAAPRSDEHHAGDVHILALSARQPAAVQALARVYADALEAQPDLHVADVCYTAAVGRAQHGCRLVVTGITARDLAGAVRARAESYVATPAHSGPSTEQTRVAWMFTGQGAQRAGMGARLYATEPTFRQALDHCDEVFQDLRSVSLRSLMGIGPDVPASSLNLHDTEWTQPALFALEYALATLWRHWGLMPTAVIGHSIGEYVAATVAGVFPVDDALRLVAARGRVMQALPSGGGMLSVFGDVETARLASAGWVNVAIAAANASNETVLSGPLDSLATIAATLAAQGIQSRALTVSHAFHSPLMTPAIEPFAEVLSTVRMSPPAIDLISNVTGTRADADIATPDYWIRHLLEPVRFRAGLETLRSMGVTHFLELGPAPVLSSLGARDSTRPTEAWLASMRPSADEPTQILTTLGRLYEAGASVNWDAVHAHRGGRLISLPTYQFQRERFWVDGPEAAVQTSGPAPDRHRVLGLQLPTLAALPQTTAWHIDRPSEQAHWQSYRVGGRTILPTAAYLELVQAAGHEVLGQSHVTIEHLALVDAEFADVSADLELQITCTRLGSRSADVSVHMRTGTSAHDLSTATWTQLATARVTSPATHATRTAVPASAVPPIDMGVMFFNGADTGDEDRYRLVMETARFADREGFSSVWVPERHYTPFGGLYPNPAVLHAALARETRQVRLMAGSIVLPLHHPLRAIEDWALVDNLSHGRAGLSIASGWNPDDFAMHPDRYADRRNQLFEQIPLLRKLWRGERVSATSGTGETIQIRTYPAPVQPELPLWVTAAGNPASFAKAGEVGAHLLTHLLDQDAEGLAGKIAIYRDAREQHGHAPETGRVTVMIHTFLGDDVETVRELVRAPYCQYIKDNIGLLKGLAYSRGEHLDLDKLLPEDIDEFVGFLYDRFFATRALLGTPESCLPLVRQLADAGVNEIACLVDFGPPTSLVVRHLPHLARLHARLTPAPRVHVAAPSVEATASIQSRCPEHFDAPAFYRQLRSRGIVIDEALRGATHFWRRDGEALARLTPAAAGDTRTIETALQAFMAAIPSDVVTDDGSALFVATALRGLEVLIPDALVTWSHATLDVSDLTGRLDLRDEAGAVVARLAHFAVRRVAPAYEERATADAGLYEVTWEEKRLDATTPSASPGTWLLLGDRAGVTQDVAARLASAGHRTIVVGPDDVGTKDADGWRALVRTTVDAHGPIRGVVHGWALDAPDTRDLTDEGLADVQERGCGVLLHVVQALATLDTPPRVWCLTRNAQAASDTVTPINIAQSLVWGFGRAIAVEHPDLWGGLIDLDARPSAADRESILQELTRDDAEDQVAYRSGQRLVPRLVARDLPAQAPAARPDLVFDPTASYLITGGVGGLGQHVARWMIESGATDVVLTGLRERDSVAIATDHAHDEVRVEVVVADASDRAAMSALVADIAARGKVLRGVVHLAGVPEDTPLVDNRIEAGRRVLSPKVAGGWVVHDITRVLPLDFFVSFSSISAVWGSRGQPFYGAANHFLDALTAYRRQQGLPAVTVSWGPWSEGGMVDAEGLVRLERMGLHALPPSEAIARLARLVAARSGSRVVVDVNWPVFKELFESRGPRPLLARVGGAGSQRGPSQTALARDLQRLDQDTRRVRLTQYVHQHLSEVLGWSAGRAPEPRRGFFDLGMDSLMALDLKNRLQDGLGLSLRATVVFNYSTVDSLAAFLATQLAPETTTDDAGAASQTHANDGKELSGDELSDDETMRRLDEQLASIASAPRPGQDSE